MPYSFFTTQMKGELMEKTEKRLYLLGWFALLVLFVMVAVLNWIKCFKLVDFSPRDLFFRS